MTILIVACLALLILLPCQDGRRSRASFGAIRWDAWTGGHATIAVERSLGPQRYHNRLPWFSTLTGPNTVRIDGSPMAVMDREIDLAADAGIDYWAFLIYPSGRHLNSSLSLALGQYLASSRRNRLRFCMILHGTLKVPDECWPDERDRLISLLGEPGYQTIPGGRPLVYLFHEDPPWERIAEFRRLAQAAGHDPYLVFMGWAPRAFLAVRDKGVDAFSAYAKPGEMTTFSGLAETTEADWATAAANDIPYVPLVTTGWDKHPRQDHPVTWEPPNQAYHQQKTWPSRATPAEIAAHLRHALAFVEAHPLICPANTVISYAWNEHDEGGWLSPTLGADGTPDTERLDAVRDILGR